MKENPADSLSFKRRYRTAKLLKEGKFTFESCCWKQAEMLARADQAANSREMQFEQGSIPHS